MSRNWFSVLLVSAIISGCSSSPKVVSDIVPLEGSFFGKVAQAELALNEAPLCCATLSDLKYRAVPANYRQTDKVTVESQAFDFASGKSFLLAYKIPQGESDLPVTISSHIKATMFSPKVAVLNSDFEVTRVVRGSAFEYKEPDGAQPHRLVASINLHRSGGAQQAEQYLVIYTTEALMGGSTQVTHAGRLKSRTTSSKASGMPDPVVPHSALGDVEVHFGRGVRSDYTPSVVVASDEVVDPNKVIVVTPQPSVASGDAGVSSTATTTATTASKRPVKKTAMLDETEEIYNQLIRKYVAQGNLNRALILVDEAETAGSRSARSTFIEAYKEQ